MPISKRSLKKPDDLTPQEKLAEAKRICHQHFGAQCPEEKRQGLHQELLKRRPHWSVLKRKEQYEAIDRGEHIPFDIAIPLPARDPRRPEESAEGVKLFWERFRCTHCGKCCYTPGAGLYLEKEDMDRICKHLGWTMKKLKRLCRYDKNLKTWALKQPCPFYDEDEKRCKIYSVRPLTCTQYPLHPPLKEMPYHLAVDAFCPEAREFAKETLGWWIICENRWAQILKNMETESKKGSGADRGDRQEPSQEGGER